MSEDIIKAEGLTKVFNSHLTAVDHVDFSVKHGEIFGFLGPNGEGKTSRDRENGAFLAVLLSSAKKCEETVVRAVKEETGLTVDKPEHVDVVDNVELDENGRVKYHFVIIDFFVNLKGGTLGASSDAAELKWVPLKEVEEYTLTKTFKEFYRRNYEKLTAMESCS